MGVLLRWLRAFETGLLVALLLVMIGVAAYQVLARNLFSTGLTWGDDLVQMAVLWVTMVGAAVAADHDDHIRIDLIGRFAGPRLRTAAARLTALFTAAVCATLGWYAIAFIRWDFIDNVPGFGVVPAWICESIIPLTAAVMAVRYLIRAIRPPEGSPAP